jgi:hypothetical protein
MIANSGQPFNITTGRDNNGDTVFSERPAFATDLTKPGVVVTPLGAFDPNPTLGQQIIPRNFGRGPAFISVNLGLEKVFKFGKAIEPKAPPAPPKTTDAAATPQKPQPKPPVQRSLHVGLLDLHHQSFQPHEQRCAGGEHGITLLLEICERFK